MKSYGQRCGLAKALDEVGDRWTLLIVRELLIRGACRYTDLRAGLPGIATNLLADRLRKLETAGLITREEAPPPIATGLFRLTERGQALEPVLLLLGQWGAPLLAARDETEDEALCAHWLVLPLRLHLADRRPDEPPVAIELRAGDQPIAVTAAGGRVEVKLGRAEAPVAIVSGTPEAMLGLLRGRTAGLRCEGEAAALARVLPSPA